MSASCSTSADLCFLSRSEKGLSIHECVSHACVLSLFLSLPCSVTCLRRPVIWFPGARPQTLQQTIRAATRQHCLNCYEIRWTPAAANPMSLKPGDEQLVCRLLKLSWHFRQWLLHVDKSRPSGGGGRGEEEQANCWCHVSVSKALSRAHLSEFILRGGRQPRSGTEVGVPPGWTSPLTPPVLPPPPYLPPGPAVSLRRKWMVTTARTQIHSGLSVGICPLRKEQK